MSFARPNARRRVVWLTSDASPAGGHGLANGADYSEEIQQAALARFGTRITPVDKTAVRFTVRLPRAWAKPWRAWADRQGMRTEDMMTLIESGGGVGAAETWYVVERPIEREYWREVVTFSTDESAGSPPGP